MFMLGNFTNGLFGGANDVFSLATKFQDLRTKFRDWGNANEVESAMQADNGANNTGGLYGTTPSTMGSSATPADRAALATTRSTMTLSYRSCPNWRRRPRSH